jgi:hypothetical protein
MINLFGFEKYMKGLRYLAFCQKSNRKHFFVALLCLFVIDANAQENSYTTTDTLQSQRLLTIINFNRDQTYATFGGGIGNQVPLIFEARFSPSYFISSNKKKWAFMMNPQVQMRMLNKRSWPIQVPSYHFYLTYYRSIDLWRKLFANKLLYTDALWFASIVHHSNGQDGKFFVNDSTKTIDLVRGNFSVNYIQLGAVVYTLRATGLQYFSLSEVKIHTDLYPAALCDPNLQKIYGFRRLFTTISFGGPWREEKKGWVNRWLQKSSLELKTGWIFGEYQDYGPVDASHRMIVDLTYKYYPGWFDEIAFFVRFYSGQDYYNVYFEKQLTTLTCGITSNTIKLSNQIRYLIKDKKKIILKK